MLTYLKTLINIALRKLGPEDLPDSQFLLGVTLVIHLLVDLPLSAMIFGPSVVLVQIIVLDLGMLIGGLWILLSLTGYVDRFRQTLIAFLGTSVLLNILMAPFTLWRQFTVGSDTESALPVIAIFAIVLWSLSINGHIVSRALSKSYSIGLGIAVIYFIFNTYAMRVLLLPDMPG
jgi:hypothetical protein